MVVSLTMKEQDKEAIQLAPATGLRVRLFPLSLTSISHITNPT